MKRGGLFAGLAVVLAFLGISNFPRGSEQPAAEPKNKATPAYQNAGIKPSSPCIEINERLRRFEETANTAAIDSWKLPDSCYKTNAPPAGARSLKSPAQLKFAIVTVPNPVTTHLPLLFDRIVETVQQAAQDDGYTYDGSWFPWQEATEYALLSDQQNADDLLKTQQSQPGILTFRQSLLAGSGDPYDGGLIIFLVGEQPTTGIRDEEFANAVAWIDRLGGVSDNRLQILGPVFSGSLPSLQRDLDRALRTLTKPDSVTLDVSSGAVSSGAGYHRFANWLSKQGRNSTFRTAMENDSLMVDRFCQYLHDQGYDPRYVAFLSEDETAFGGGDTNRETCSQAIRLYYPRDIATLRSEYQKQSVFGTSKSQLKENEPSTTLRGDLSEPANNEHDTVRSYGAQLTPLPQESILLDITNRLQEKQIQFIVLRSTNSLDQIFLSEFLRRAYPAGRVVIDGADLLFDRGAEGRSLRGVMLLTTYPLIPSNQDWTSSLISKPNGTYRTFGEDIVESEYIAARELLANRPTRIPIHDYAPPAWAESAKRSPNSGVLPPTWVTVVSHRQFWPLAVLTDSTRMPPSILTPSAAIDSSSVEDRPLLVPPDMWMFLMVFVGWSAVHCWFCWNASFLGLPRARAYFAPIPLWQHPALIVCGSVLIGIAAIVIAATSGLFQWLAGMHPFGRPWSGFSLAAALAAGAGCAAAGCLKNFNLPVLRAKPFAISDQRIRRWHVIAATSGVITLAAFAWIHFYLVSRLTPENAIPAFWRSVHLFSGVSPLVPQVLLIGGAYLWFWCSLRGSALFGDDRPLLPGLWDLPARNGEPMMPMYSQEIAGDALERAAIPLSATYLRWLLAIFPIVLIACAVALQDFAIRTLGERPFGQFIFWWLCVFVTIVLADGIQIWRAWNALHELLRYLDRLTLRRTLQSLKGLAWGTIWKLSANVLEERYRAISLQFESLRHLENAVQKWAPKDAAETENQTAVTEKLSAFRETSDSFACWYVSFCKGSPSVGEARTADFTKARQYQLELASTAGTVMQKILLPEWRKETESLIFEKPAEDGKTEVVPAGKLPPHVRAAEEFFILPYLAFIQNSLGRIRTIAIGDLWLFVCTTLAVSSYPFDPLNVLGGIFLAVFLIYGGIIVLVYSQMSRDATLSHITDTRPGELGWEFWERLIAFGIGPLVGLLTTLFPSLTDFLFSWLQPSAQALK